MIPKETIDKIFETARVEEVVGEYIQLKKRGINLLGSCPFHDEKTPSFTVSPTKGIYKCFGCGKGGNSVNFVMEYEGISYPESLRKIAHKYNIEIEEEELTSAQIASSNERESLLVISKFAVQFFQASLWKTEEGKAVGLSYFKERGFSEDIIKKFQLGYSPKQKDAFSSKALQNSYDKEYLEKSGLTILKDDNVYDRFRERVIFPITNSSGKVLGFGGRALNPKAKAKYVNSPESKIYHKSNVLYGLYFAKQAIRKLDNCYVVEGYTDVLSLHQKEVENVVSSSGTAFTKEQIKLISRNTNTITLLFDSDDAGKNATNKSIDMILTEGLNVKLVLFPDGEDPDSYSKKLSIDELQQFLHNNTLDFITYKAQKLNEISKTDPVKSAQVKREIIYSISLIPDYIIRTEYCKVCCKTIQMKEVEMLQLVDAERKKKRFAEHKINTPKLKVSAPLNKEEKLYKLEEEIIRILLNYGNEKLIYEEDESTVAELIINELEVDNIAFEYPILHQLYSEGISLIKTSGMIDLQYFINHQNQKISALTIDIISSKHTISNNWEQRHKIYTGRENEKMRNTTEKAILALKKAHVDKQISILQDRIETGKIETDDFQLLKQLTQIKTQISKSLGRNVG